MSSSEAADNIATVWPMSGQDTTILTDFYTIGRELGNTQFSTLFVVTEISTGVEYACKSLFKRRMREKMPDEEYVQEVKDVRREIQIMQHLAGHENIESIKEVHEDDYFIHFVMEQCFGGDLSDHVKERGYLSEKQAAEFMKIIMGVVEYCHSLGVMHRDLKPENFLVYDKDDRLTLKTTRFTKSTFFQPGEVLTEIIGSPYYMAPEVIRMSYGPEADVWSAGVILYELLTGVLPFWAKTYEEVFVKILKGAIGSVPESWQYISDTAKDLIKKMLCANTAERLTPHEVLSHPWMSENGVAPPGPALEPAVLSCLKQFLPMNKLKKLALRVITAQLPAEEYAGFGAVFNSMDTNNDGAITFDELKAGLRRYGCTLNDIEIERLLDGADLNRNGSLDFGEFIAATLQLNELKQEEYFAAAFAYFDRDGKGYIEFDDLEESFLEQSMTDVSIIKIMKEVDLDKNRRIDYGEFAAMMTRGYVEPAVETVDEVQTLDGVDIPTIFHGMYISKVEIVDGERIFTAVLEL